jgi:diguanylate cyclase (GGDEF)-like protein
MTRLGLIRVLACWLVFSAILQAQRYDFHVYRQAEGLKNLAVNALTTDSSGFLWVATENGVYRFLGSNFEQYGKEQGIAERDVEDIYADPSGAVWAGTDENLYRWDGQRFQAVGKVPIQIQGARRIATEDARHLLVVDKGRLYRLEHDAQGRMLSYAPVFSDQMLASIPELSQLTSLGVAGDRTVWTGCGTKLCSWIEGHESTVTQWGTDKGVPRSIWRSVLMDRAGTHWAADQLYHVVALPSGATRFVNRSISSSDPNSVYQHAALVEDPEGRVLASAAEGVARWEGAGWRIIGTSSGMRSGHITSMSLDLAGDLWLGGFGRGLFHWIGLKDWEGWSELVGLPSPNILSSFPVRQDRVLVGTEKGPAWINPQNGSAGSLFSGQMWTYGQVSGIGTNRDGSVWAGTFSGAVLRIDPKTRRVNQTARLPALIAHAIQDPAGRVFFITDKGIYLREARAPNAPPHRIPAVDALLGDYTRVDAGCVAPDGAVWLLADNRLLREQEGRWTVLPVDNLPKLNGPLLYLSCGTNGVMWATGQRTGILRFTLSNERLKAWRLVIPPEFSTLAPLAILADRRGWVWLGTDMGLVVWNGAEWRHLTQETGLIWDDVNKGTLTNGLDGSLWLETSGGLSHLLHSEHVFDPALLTVSVTGIQRDDQVYQSGQPLILPWSVAPLRFHISSPSERNRSELIFKYRLEGLQTEWIESRNGIAIYSALPPGKYTFMTMASNLGLSAISPTVKIQIQILPPWWKTIWFYAFCILAILLLLGAAGHFYVRQLRARSRHLEALVSERTRELEHSREQLRVQASHDGLTGMLNRTAVLRILTAEMERARRESRTVVIALVDLDHFKRINDSYGHLAGDEALRWFAAAVGAAIRPYDHAGRYGGEEFLLVLTELPHEAVEQRLARLHAAISNLKVCERGIQFMLNCSMGATVFDPTDQAGSVESLLAIADQALYAAKAQGRNCIVFRAHVNVGSQQQESTQSIAQVDQHGN